jgi:hypothetical protein
MVVLLGGDQSNEVNRTAFSPNDITAYRWPAGWPVAAAAYNLPSIRPTGAPDADDGSPRREAGNAVPTGDPASIDTAEYRSPGGEQSLRIRRLADDRIRFQLQNASCRRTMTGTAYEIYPGDAQIDAEGGIGYPAREYFFWADSLGRRGLSIRLSIAGPPRARAIEWGFQPPCPNAGSVMHGDARPAGASGETLNAIRRPLAGEDTARCSIPRGSPLLRPAPWQSIRVSQRRAVVLRGQRLPRLAARV